MNILRKVGISLSAFILSASLFSACFAHIGTSTIRDRETVQGWFDDSRFYDKIAPVILEQINKSSANTNDQLPLDDPTISSSVEGAFDAEFLRSNITNVLNGSYSWLDGTASDLDFTINVGDAKSEIADGIGKYVTTRVNDLPVCASAIRSSSDFDGLTATCRPSPLKPEDAGVLAKEEFLASNFLNDAVISADTITLKNSEGVEVPLALDQNVQNIRSAYQLSEFLAVVFGVLALMSCVVLILLSKPRNKGLKRAGWILVSTGALLSLAYLALGVGFDVIENNIQYSFADNLPLAKLYVDIAREILNSVKNLLVWFAAGYSAIGLLFVLLGYIISRKQKRVPQIQAEPEQHEDKTTTPEHTEPLKPANAPTSQIPVSTKSETVPELPLGKKPKRPLIQ